jgi:hypothetical protein
MVHALVHLHLLASGLLFAWVIAAYVTADGQARRHDGEHEQGGADAPPGAGQGTDERETELETGGRDEDEHDVPRCGTCAQVR